MLLARRRKGSLPFVHQFHHFLRRLAYTAAPPVATGAYGHTWNDEYEWMRSKPRRAEEALREEERHFRSTANRLNLNALALQIRSEIHDVLPPNDTVSVPERIGDHEYYVRQTKGRPLPCYLRRRWSGSGVLHSPQEETVVLDANELAKVHGEDISIGQVR